MKSLFLCPKTPGCKLCLLYTSIGIFEEGDIALSGVELDKMSDEQLAQQLEHVSVYARVSPEHKIRIVDEMCIRDRCYASWLSRAS